MPSSGDAAEPILAGRRVLIVEDRYLIAAEMADEVARLGGEVIGPTGSVATASELAAAPVDIALLDVNLDGEWVFPLAEVLARKGVPMIFLTGYDDDSMPEAWRDHPRLRKPVSGRSLRAELMKLTTRS